MENVFGPRHFFHTVRDPVFYLYNDTILSKELACHLHFFG